MFRLKPLGALRSEVYTKKMFSSEINTREGKKRSFFPYREVRNLLREKMVTTARPLYAGVRKGKMQS